LLPAEIMSGGYAVPDILLACANAERGAGRTAYI